MELFTSKNRTRTAKATSYLAAAGLLVLLGTTAFGQGPAPVASCESLAKLALPNATITMAQQVAAGEFKVPQTNNRPPGAPAAAPGPGGAAAAAGGAPGGGPGGPGGGQRVDTQSLPAFCRVAATLKPTSDSDIKIEVWLPLSGWNGNLLGVGGGGTAGRITYTSTMPLGLIEALRMGYAAANTDDGHDAAVDGGSLSFIVGHPEKLIDYSYRSNHEMTVKAKALIAAYYGVPPSHSYFIGCSLGSMQAINEAKRFPEDYDGVIAGALMNPVARFNAAQLWPAWLAAKDPAKAISREKIAMIHQAVLKACATPVGLNDGEVERPDHCDFDPVSLLCKAGDAADCLTAPQVEMMRQVYQGPVNPRTKELIFPGVAKGAESEVAGNNATPHNASLELYKYAIHQDPNWDWKTMDYDTDIALADKMVGPYMYADSNLKPFFDRGGKLMIYIGWEDYHNPIQVIGYYNSVLKTVGSEAKDSIRLFNVPGMGHCTGGNGCSSFDKVGVVAKWVQDGKAPEQILSTHLAADGKVIRSRPLCAYPKVATYTGKGDINDASSFVCAVETAPAKQ